MRPPPAKPIPELDTRDEQNDQAQNFAEVYSGRIQKFTPRPGVNPAFLLAKPVYQAWKQQRKKREGLGRPRFAPSNPASGFSNASPAEYWSMMRGMRAHLGVMNSLQES
jgi:hypothetical protein